MSFSYAKIKPRDDTYTEIETSSDNYLEIYGYCQCVWKRVLYYSLVFLTLGFVWLVVRWKPALGIRLTSQRCPLSIADTVILKDSHGIYSVAHVCEERLSSSSHISGNSPYLTAVQNQELTAVRYFIHKCLRYIWNNENCAFKQLRGIDFDVPCSDFSTKFHGLSKLEQEEKLQIYGPNRTDVEVKSYFNLLINEVLNPFYIFQVASIILWMSDNYYYYASAIFIISIVSICVSLYETKRQQISLHDMAGRFSSLEICVCRGNGEYENISVNDLVLGDVISIPPHGCHMTCDAVLIAGSCIVNESMLTGESVPETKIPLGKHCDDEFYNSRLHKKHTLFSGTEIIQTRYYGSEKVLAVVTKTGFLTAKGELLCSMMFPRPLGFKFFNEAMRFIILLFFLSALGMAYSLYLYIKRGAAVFTTIRRALDLITIVVPPALPAALTVGTVYAQNRLKKQEIFCISQLHINVAGRIKLVCFDKTGTLTTEGLDLWGVIPVDDGSFRPAVHQPSHLPNDSRHIIAMATCHSLTIIDKQLTGDPLDLKMFQATEWRLEEPGTDNNKYDMLPPTIVHPPESKSNGGPGEVGIIRQFPFSSSMQRMSVVCRALGANHMDLYSKGAPEKIISLCLPYTVPEDFEILLQNYTLKGFRVIAFAWRPLEPKLSWHHVHRSKRGDLEKDMVFLGLLIMQNMLKPETMPIIGCLKKAEIRSVMVTGDNLLTALSVARECGMVPLNERIILITASGPDLQNPAKIKWEYAESSSPGLICDMTTSFDVNSTVELYQTVYLEENNHFHFAVDGKSFAILHEYFPEIVPKVVVRGTVFARMSPDQKTQLVEALQEVGYVVGMCGDGANDCGALKAADVGISLSDAEASVAAPFTSKVQNIECVPKVIKEGRCALVTAVSVFKFISLYSIIQFTSVLVVYTVGTNLADAMFLYVDLPIITTLAIVMSYTKAYEELVPEKPHGTLINIPTITSLLLQVCLVIGGQVAVLLYLQSREWYVPILQTKDEIVVACWENSSIFLFTCYQYISASVVFSRGPPYRKPFYTNVYFLVALIILVAFSTLLLLNPFRSLAAFFQIVQWQPSEHFYFRLTLLLMAGCSFIFSLAIETVFAESKWLKQVAKSLKRNSASKDGYERVEDEIRSNLCWPNIEEPVYAIGPTHALSI